MQQPDTVKKDISKKSRWHAPHAPKGAVFLGFLAAAILLAELPARLTILPGWVPLAVTVLILAIVVVLWLVLEEPRPKVTRTLTYLLLGFITLALFSGVFLLIKTLPSRTEKEAGGLLVEASLLWASNILVFALWYWETDGGGPLHRHIMGYKAVDFMFPQQVDGNTRGWRPLFMDYLFLAFNTATAFSPTDTYPLSRMAKAFMMVQSIVSLLIVIVLAARAINIL